MRAKEDIQTTQIPLFEVDSLFKFRKSKNLLVNLSTKKRNNIWQYDVFFVSLPQLGSIMA